ncbi:MAG: hypothetical protein RR415_12665 [Ruthenibacterium sp.]
MAMDILSTLVEYSRPQLTIVKNATSAICTQWLRKTRWRMTNSKKARNVDAPKGGVTPTAHGQWIEEYVPDEWETSRFHCSICDSDFHRTLIVRATDFCPDCGAKMEKSSAVVVALFVFQYDEEENVVSQKKFVVRKDFLEKYLDGSETVASYLEESTSDTNEDVYSQALLDNAIVFEERF